MNSQLPIELDVFLINLGFFEPGQMPDFHPYRFKHRQSQIMVVSTSPERLSGHKDHGHTPVHIKQEEDDIRSQRGWTPAYPGEEPPF
jgi:hypothetical protein